MNAPTTRAEPTAPAKKILVLDMPDTGGRDIVETISATQMNPSPVDDLEQLIERLREREALVAVIAYEALWPRPQEAVRRIRDRVSGCRLVVVHSEGTARFQLGQRLWAVNLIDYFLDRSTPPHELDPLLRQAHADALIEEAAIEHEPTPSTDQDRYASIRFVHELNKGFNNQRQVEGLARLLHRKLPYFMDYAVLELLVVNEVRPRLHVFPAYPVEHGATWKLAQAVCGALTPFTEQTVNPEEMQIVENAPFAARDEDIPVPEGQPDVTICAPMVIHGEPVGCLGLLLPRGTQPSSEQQVMLQLIASQLGAALRNAQALRAAEDASLVDELTGLHNRRYLRDVLASEWRRARRYSHPVSVAMVDIDRFKQLNDEHGHIVGDHVLRAVAGTLGQYLRETDHLVRFGGEEFLLLLPETGPSEAAMVIERIRLALKRQPAYSSEETGPIQVTFSAGVAAYPICSVPTADDLVHLADQALLTAKRSGRDQVCMAAATAIQNLHDQLDFPEGGDKRRFPRIASRLRVRYVELPDFEGQLADASSLDVSAGGLALRDPERRLKPHSYALVFVEGDQAPVLSRVVWTKDTDTGDRKAGLQFLRARDFESGVKLTQKIKALPRALVIADQQHTRAMIERVLTAARYQMKVIDSPDKLRSDENLSRYALVVIGETSLRTWLGGKLEGLREGLRSPGRIVVINESADRKEAIKTIGTRKVEHLVPLNEASDEALFATLNKLLLGEYFGMQKYLLWGVNPSSWTITRKGDKQVVLDGIRRVAQEVHCHPRIADLLIAAVEEMLINAMYHGRGVDESEKVPKVTVDCGTDGRLLAVAVLDEHGVFRHDDLCRGLGAALQRETDGIPVDAKSAQLGFHIMLSCLSQLAINVDPGRCTEVIGIVDLRKSLREYRQAVPTLGVFSKED